MLTSLDRKLLRDVWHMKSQVLAICLVLACGVATFIMATSTYAALTRLKDQYYRDYRFAHVFAYVTRAPNTLAQRMAELPGVLRMETRIVAEVTLDVPGFSEPATARLLSLPAHGAPMLNALYVRSGRLPERGRGGAGGGEVVVSERFAEAHDMQLGAQVRVVLNGRLRELTIVGIVLSPEFIYEIREGELLPDPLRYGVFWMHEDELAAAFNLSGAFNSATMQLMPGANEADVIDQLDHLTEPYGGLGAFGRDNQSSHRYVKGELEQLRALAVIIPSIFLIVAAFLMNMVISRLIQTQREQIAALKAFGYSRAEIAGHYLKFVGVVAVIGLVLGVYVGSSLGQWMTGMYAEFFRFPHLSYRLDARSVVPAILISAAVALAGTFTALRRATMLPPAEAMRPEPPATFRTTIAERIGLSAVLSPSTRMILRNLERQPVRSTLTVLGIALALAISLLGNFNKDVTDFLIDYEFNRTQRYDVMVTCVEPTNRAALHELQRMPGVLHSEPFRAVPVRLRAEYRTHRLAILGIESERDLLNLTDRFGRTFDIPPQGLILSAQLGQMLGVDVGDHVTVEVLEGRRPIHEIQVAGLFEDYTGLAAYMDLRAVHRIMREQDAISGAYLSVDDNRKDALYRELKQTPGIASVVIKRAAIDSFRQLMTENLDRMRIVNVIFASIIAFGVIYNSSRITLAERGWELATLRVIGFTRQEISLILLGELAVLTLVAIPLGLLIGHGMATFAVQALQTEYQRFPLVIRPETYAFAALTVLAAACITGLIVRRRLDRLDLIAVLKTRE